MSVQLIGDCKKLKRSEKGGIGFYYRQFIDTDGVNDCAPTAIAILHGVQYYKQIDDLLLKSELRISSKKGTYTRKFCSSIYGQGFKEIFSMYKIVVNDRPNWTTVAGFAAMYPKGKFLVRTHKHVIAVINGTVYEFSHRVRMGGARVKNVWELVDESILINYL